MGVTDRPRVLVDATAVPADRGGVGRYVDELLPGAGRRRAPTSPSSARPTTSSTTARCCPGVDLRAGAGGDRPRRPVRLAWEQAGLPALVAPQPGARSCTARTTRCRCAPGCPS